MPGGMVAPSLGQNPDATRLASYIDSIHAAGYGDIDPTIQAATSQGAINHPIHNTVLDTIKNGLATGWNTVGHYFSDPAVQQPPTTAQQVADHLQGTGIKPSTPPEIQVMQNQMLKAGYGKGLQANGVWSSDWNSQHYQMGIDVNV
jgi:hypothetical protein